MSSLKTLFTTINNSYQLLKTTEEHSNSNILLKSLQNNKKYEQK